MYYLGLKDNTTVKGNLFITCYHIPTDDETVMVLFDDCKDSQKWKEVKGTDFHKIFDILSKA